MERPSLTLSSWSKVYINTSKTKEIFLVLDKMVKCQKEVTDKKKKKSEKLHLHLNHKFGIFTKDGKKIDLTCGICKECHMKVKYSGNVTNIRDHLTHKRLAVMLANDSKVNLNLD